MDKHHLLRRLLRRLAAPVIRVGSVTFFERDLTVPVPRAEAPAGFEVRRATPLDLELLCEGRRPARPAEVMRARFRDGDQCFLAIDPSGRVAQSTWVSFEHGYIPELDMDLTLGPGEAYAYDSYTRSDVRGRSVFAAVRQLVCDGLLDQGRKRLRTYVAGDNAKGLVGAAHWQDTTGRLRYARLFGVKTVVWGGCAVNLTAHAGGRGALPASRKRPASDLRVDTITDTEAFLALEPVWDDLVERARIPHPFLTHAWVRSFWEAFGKGKELRILAAFSGQTCIGLAPLMMRRAWKYAMPLRQLELIGNKHTPRSDFIIASRHEEAYRAIWGELERQGADWDVVVLPQLVAASQTLEEMNQLAKERSLLTGVWTSSASPRLRLRGSWESYFQSRAAKHRSNLRNRLGRLQRLGPVETEEITGGDQLARALDEGLRIEAAAWKGKNGTAIASRPESRLFYERFAERAAQRGWLRLQFLKVSGKRIAFNYCLRFRNTLYILKQGYDPEYAPYSPFNLLCFYLLQDAFRSGVSAVDFLGCEEPWKRSWTEESHGHSWLYLFQDRWRTRPVHFTKFRVLPAVRGTGFHLALRAASEALSAPLRLAQRSR